MTASFVITLTNLHDAADPSAVAEELFEILTSEGLVVVTVNPWARPESGTVQQPTSTL